MLAVVEDDESPAVAQPVGQQRRQRCAAPLPNPEHDRHLAGDRRAQRQRGEVDEVDAPRVGGAACRASSRPSRVFPLPPTPLSVNSLVAARSRPRARELLLAADEMAEGGWEHRRPGGCQGRIAAINRAAQLRELVARINPELVLQQPTGGGVNGQCVGAAVTTVQGEHELAREPFPGRAGGERALQLGDQLGMPTERQVRIDALLQSHQPQLFQSDCPRRGCRAHRDSTEYLTAPERKRGGQAG